MVILPSAQRERGKSLKRPGNSKFARAAIPSLRVMLRHVPIATDIDSTATRTISSLMRDCLLRVPRRA